MAQPFQNLYHQRAVGTAKPCYICRRQTTIVLATINTTDFLYTCATHLTDPGFATPMTPEPQVSTIPKVSQQDIQKIKEEWEAKQKLTKEKGKEKEKEKEMEKKETSNTGGKSPPPSSSSATTSATAAATTAGTSAQQQRSSSPSHPRFTLHRQIFAMRLAEHKKRRQAQQAQAQAQAAAAALKTASLYSNIPPPPPLP